MDTGCYYNLVCSCYSSRWINVIYSPILYRVAPLDTGGNNSSEIITLSVYHLPSNTLLTRDKTKPSPNRVLSSCHVPCLYGWDITLKVGYILFSVCLLYCCHIGDVLISEKWLPLLVQEILFGQAFTHPEGMIHCRELHMQIFSLQNNMLENIAVNNHVCQGVTALTHWGRVTHICVGNLPTIGSDNGLSPDRRQAIIWTNAGILFIGP